MLRLIIELIKNNDGSTNYLNTSHVEVNQLDWSMENSTMLYLNTSHVEVNQMKLYYKKV